jgi:hypothetical protein
MLPLRLGLAHRTASRAAEVMRDANAVMSLRRHLPLCSNEVRALV